MAELVEEIDLGRGMTKKIYSDGRVTVTDSSGKFAPGGSLPSEIARSLPTAGRKQAQSQEIDEILLELGLSGPSAIRLCEIFTSGGSGSVSAGRELIRMSSRSPGGDGNDEGEGPCPVCGRWPIGKLDMGGVNIDVDKLLMIIQAMQ